MSDQLTKRAADRRAAVKAALQRAENPQVFNEPYRPATRRLQNAEYGFQVQRQRLPLCLIGFHWSWLTSQLRKTAYRHWTKVIVTRWFQVKKPYGRFRRLATNGYLKRVYRMYYSKRRYPEPISGRRVRRRSRRRRRRAR